VRLLRQSKFTNIQHFFFVITGDGPIRGVVAIASGTGGVRGYVGSPMLGDMSLVDAVGKGSVQIVKNHPDWPRPYNGITSIRHGDIDRDIGTYGTED
jgi:molecular chaperone Hsp33